MDLVDLLNELKDFFIFSLTYEPQVVMFILLCAISMFVGCCKIRRLWQASVRCGKSPAQAQSS